MISIQALEEKTVRAEEMPGECELCPRRCGANRLKDEKGVCGTGKSAIVHSSGPHFGEEPPLVGINGSGTIFFSGCNLKCIFCQNYETSQLIAGKVVSSGELARIMLSLQNSGCHNINLVSPTHAVPHILKALLMARRKGLSLPVVYNCGGYDSVDTLRLLDGVIDIYMPDIKYMEAEIGMQLSGVTDYPEVVRKALLEMHRQVGVLEVDQGGVALRGVLIRHLVLPGGLAGTEETMRFIASSLSRDSYVNVMGQYRPAWNASRDDRINRCVSSGEVDAAKEIAAREGLWRGL